MSVAGAAFVDDETIKTALADEGATEYLSVETIRDILAEVQSGMVHTWGALLDRVREGDVQLLSAGEVFVFATDAGCELDEAIAHAPTMERLSKADRDVARRVVRLIHHDIAERTTDYNWAYSDTLVLGQSGLDAEAGVDLADAYINGLVARGATPGQAWSYWGVEIRGESQLGWARQVDRDQSTISEQVGKIGAEELGY